VIYDVSMGIYVYEHRALDVVPEDRPCQFPAVVRRLLHAGELVCPYRSDAVRYDIGTFAEYERAMKDLSEHPELFTTVGPDAQVAMPSAVAP
jgi:mannose-1-phosphate guanylyltransferase